MPGHGLALLSFRAGRWLSQHACLPNLTHGRSQHCKSLPGYACLPPFLLNLGALPPAPLSCLSAFLPAYLPRLLQVSTR